VEARQRRGGVVTPRRPLAATATLTLLASFSPPAGADMPEDIDQFRWKKRLLFVFSEDAEAAGAARRALESAADGIEERHVLWFVVAGQRIISNHTGALDPGLAASLRSRYLTEPAPPIAVVLVGKDGGVKYDAAALEIDDVFREIDGMPMRRREMAADSP
jgi:hypothetical protein